MVKGHILGYPRIGKQREAKKAVEAYWKGDIDQSALIEAGKSIRQTHWQAQVEANLDFITVGDFSWYDHVLDMSVLLGCIPPRFQHTGDRVELDTLFRMARGRAPTGTDQTACEMTKWFDTNYHYIVPEFSKEQSFRLSSDHLVQQIREAKTYQKAIKPVIIGPITYLWLGKAKGESFDKLTLLPQLLKAYQDLLQELKSEQIEWVQIDEPILALDLPEDWQNAYEKTYHQLAQSKLKILMATYFDTIEPNLTAIASLPIEGLHIDCVRCESQWLKIVDRLSDYKVISCGVINGRNIWRTDLSKQLSLLEKMHARLGDRLWVAPSCSLLHSPVDLEQEEKLDPEIKQWLAFAEQKLHEVTYLKRGVTEGRDSIKEALERSDKAVANRQSSQLIHNQTVKQAVSNLSETMLKRQNPYSKRALSQKEALNLELFPTTTIGSFPQTQQIRHARRQYKNGDISYEAYQEAMQAEIDLVVKKQESLGLDVLVHGEPERNDMVEYFGEQLSGFAFTQHGWVQSYGSRCVKPPIIYGDVSRPKSMTVEWSTYAQKQTNRLMKGMLTGPVTILCWSFVRDDQTREETAMQIALAIREEVCDLEKNDIQVIQIDEPAFREGLPLRKGNQQAYLEWAVKAFKAAVCGVQDKTQIHTHMCYSEFNELIEHIAAMDADVITIESSRSDMELLEAFETFAYPNEIGPGIYDIHSPRVPSTDEMVKLIELAVEKIPAERLWVNPDCGLKTRDWPETEEALTHMVKAASIVREKIKGKLAVA